MEPDPGPEERERLFDELTRSTSDILWMFSGDWSELVFVNDAYEDVWGRSTGALRADPGDFLNGVHPDDRPDVRSAMEQLSAGEEVEIEYRVNADEDYGRWVWVQGKPIFDDDGEVVRVAGFARDITERKERERRLAASEQRYRRLLEVSPAPVFIYTMDPELTYANEAAVDLLGADDPSDVLGTRAGQFTHPESRPDVERRRERLVEDREPVPPLEEKLVDVNGDVKHAILASTPATYEGEPAIQTVATDITGQKRRERDLARQNERLDAFSTVISHDLRNPLNVAMGRTDLAKEECDSAHLEEVERAHDRMDDMIEDLLTLARHGEMVESVEPVDLDDMVEKCWRTVATADAELDIRADGTILADGSRLRQLLENLVRNAVEHGGDDVTITMGDLDGDAGFYLADDGAGIPADERDRVFEAGYTLSEDGTGFGLAIVREIASAHGWEVDVGESEDGGARFEISDVEVASG